MLIDKIRHGVLAVQTESGVRYLQPSFIQRLRLVWTFRNFHVLPEEVLHGHERALVSVLCRKGKYVANWNGHGDLSENCIGTIERMNHRRQPPAAASSAADRPSPRAAHTILPRVS
jgi:hypothetical protein